MHRLHRPCTFVSSASERSVTPAARALINEIRMCAMSPARPPPVRLRRGRHHRCQHHRAEAPASGVARHRRRPPRRARGPTHHFGQYGRGPPLDPARRAGAFVCSSGTPYCGMAEQTARAPSTTAHRQCLCTATCCQCVVRNSPPRNSVQSSCDPAAPCCDWLHWPWCSGCGLRTVCCRAAWLEKLWCRSTRCSRAVLCAAAGVESLGDVLAWP